MYFELIKEVIKYTLNIGCSKKNLETLGIIKNREDITKDKLLSYLDYLFSFTTNTYKKLALRNILNNFEVYYQIERIVLFNKDKQCNHIVTIRDNIASKYVNKFRSYEDAAAKILWLQSEDKRLNRELITYRILGYMSYVASDVEYLSSSSEDSLLTEALCVEEWSDKDYFTYENSFIDFTE